MSSAPGERLSQSYDASLPGWVRTTHVSCHFQAREPLDKSGAHRELKIRIKRPVLSSRGAIPDDNGRV